MKRALKKLVFVEPKSTHLHIYSRVCIPRLGSVLLGTIMRAKGYDVAYAEYNGGHDYFSWRWALPQSLVALTDSFP